MHLAGTGKSCAAELIALTTTDDFFITVVLTMRFCAFLVLFRSHSPCYCIVVMWPSEVVARDWTLSSRLAYKISWRLTYMPSQGINVLTIQQFVRPDNSGRSFVRHNNPQCIGIYRGLWTVGYGQNLLLGDEGLSLSLHYNSNNVETEVTKFGTYDDPDTACEFVSRISEVSVVWLEEDGRELHCCSYSLRWRCDVSIFCQS